jgi:hypothetical protein
MRPFCQFFGVGFDSLSVFRLEEGNEKSVMSGPEEKGLRRLRWCLTRRFLDVGRQNSQSEDSLLSILGRRIFFTFLF